MNQTLKHIEFLATNHDCVIIPGLGAIVAHAETSVYDEMTSCWSVPGRSYMFNGALNINDGLLISSVARANSISHERARMIVEEDVMSMTRQLKVDNLLSLGRLGDLMIGEDGRMVFSPMNEDALTPGVTWYPKVYSRKTVDMQYVDTEIIADNHGIMHLSPVKRFVRVAAMIAILVGLGITLSTPIKVDNVAYASLSGPKITSPKVVTLNKPDNNDATKIQNLNVSKDVNIEKGDNLRSAKGNKELVDVTQPTDDLKSATSICAMPVELRNDEKDSYCLVIASLKTREGAQKFISMEKPHNPDLPMYVIEQKGHYRVYVATGATEAQALKAAYDKRVQRYKGVWVTKR
ncbi:MAG: SPOR domain-containing protein [Muribaculaceae bacterium]|nr:SPOR domain-containing protein [Muribaculaceae bacterium]